MTIDMTRGALDEPDLLLNKAYVAGKWLGGHAAPIPVDDPFTLGQFGEIPNLGADETQAAIDAAEAAFPAWARRPVKERCAILRRWSELIVTTAKTLPFGPTVRARIRV